MESSSWFLLIFAVVFIVCIGSVYLIRRYYNYKEVINLAEEITQITQNINLFKEKLTDIKEDSITSCPGCKGKGCSLLPPGIVITCVLCGGAGKIKENPYLDNQLSELINEREKLMKSIMSRQKNMI